MLDGVELRVDQQADRCHECRRVARLPRASLPTGQQPLLLRGLRHSREDPLLAERRRLPNRRGCHLGILQDSQTKRFEEARQISAPGHGSARLPDVRENVAEERRLVRRGEPLQICPIRQPAKGSVILCR